jgi:signal transduction histidine kinase
VIRHVGPTRVGIALDYSPEHVQVRVVDEGADGAAAGGGGPVDGGRGIVGMRERCQLLGGELDARPRPEGGFEVTARLPLAPSASVAG